VLDPFACLIYFSDALGIIHMRSEPLAIANDIGGIQSGRFGRDPVAVSQSFLDRFVSGETALKRPATLNVSLHSAFLMWCFPT